MNVLLDTSTVIWALTDVDRLSPYAVRLLDDSHSQLHVSAASAWEVATKHRLGRLPAVGPLLDRWSKTLSEFQITSLAIAHDDAIRGGAYRVDHADPFDRLIAAQAELRGMTVVSSDEAFDLFPVDRLW